MPLPFVTLVQPPTLPPLEPSVLTQEREAEIARLIHSLSQVESKDIGLLRWSSRGDFFLPVGRLPFRYIGREGWRVESHAAIQKLVEIGPVAMPLLLENLDNAAPTELVVETVRPRLPASAGGLAFDEILHGNPANPTEQFVLNLHREPYTPSIRSDEASLEEMESYRVKVGDVCFVIIGHIVGRDYQCVFREHVKSSAMLVCSPVHRPQVRDNVRHIWESNNPHQKVLESLLLDFSTRGLLQGNFLDDWDLANEFQNEAAMRLLFYYPNEAAEVISERLLALDVSDGDDFEQCVQNGVIADEFIYAVGWSGNEHIRLALQSLAEKAMQREIVEALQGVENRRADR